MWFSLLFYKHNMRLQKLDMLDFQWRKRWSACPVFFCPSLEMPRTVPRNFHGEPPETKLLSTSNNIYCHINIYIYKYQQHLSTSIHLYHTISDIYNFVLHLRLRSRSVPLRGEPVDWLNIIRTYETHVIWSQVSRCVKCFSLERIFWCYEVFNSMILPFVYEKVKLLGAGNILTSPTLQEPRFRHFLCALG